MTRSPLPLWGEKAKVLTKVGAGVWGALILIGWGLRAVDFVTGARPPQALAWVLAITGGAGFALLVLAGVVWLVAEFATGLREPPQPD